MDKNNLSKKVGLLLAGCFITFNARKRLRINTLPFIVKVLTFAP